MLYFGTLIYFLIWVSMALLGHIWIGMGLGLVGWVTYFSIFWKCKFGTFRFWKP